MTSSTVTGINPIDVSPIRADLKHPTTPLRPRCKTSRKDQASDVHSSCSTPNRFQSNPLGSCFNSPSDSFPYSQDNRPDVYWDYTSPKLPKGAKKKEIKLTVEEFLKNMSQHQAPECKSQSSNYIKLLEKWMTKQNTPMQSKVQRSRILKKDNKKRSRRVMEEIKQFMESIQNKGDNEGPINKLDENGGNLPVANTSSYLNIALDKKSFLEGDSPENDSADDLWGDIDNSFIVKATQQLDALSKMEAFDKNAEIISTIPETIINSAKEANGYSSERSTGNKINLNCGILDADYHAQILLSQIMSQDWDSASDLDDWDNGFIEEDEALSLIPDEVLCGTDVSSSPQNNLDKTVVNTNSVQTAQAFTNEDSKRNCPQVLLGDPVVENVTKDKSISSAEVVDSFEDEIFSEDEGILSRPEVLSWIDEVENKLSQSQKCTPEEIEKKKGEALQRRKSQKTKS